MWPFITILALLVFLLLVILLWKETPGTPDWVSYQDVKNDFPTWTPLFVCLSFIFRKGSKITFLLAIGSSGFLAIGAVWGNDLWEFLVWLLSEKAPTDEIETT